MDKKHTKGPLGVRGRTILEPLWMDGRGLDSVCIAMHVADGSNESKKGSFGTSSGTKGTSGQFL